MVSGSNEGKSYIVHLTESQLHNVLLLNVPTPEPFSK